MIFGNVFPFAQVPDERKTCNNKKLLCILFVDVNAYLDLLSNELFGNLGVQRKWTIFIQAHSDKEIHRQISKQKQGKVRFIDKFRTGPSSCWQFKQTDTNTYRVKIGNLQSPWKCHFTKHLCHNPEVHLNRSCKGFHRSMKNYEIYFPS